MSAAKTVHIIMGPTAVGKTARSIELAKQLGTEIISADSRQCYREMNIGVARPSEEELAMVPHHFIASHSIMDEVNAASFASFALAKTADLFEKYDDVVMTGGTGLYIKSFCEGLDTIPPIPPDIRKKIIGSYDVNGIEWLQQQLKQQDPLYFQSGEMQNPQRMMRALEVVEATGQSIITFRKTRTEIRPFNIRKTLMELPRPELNDRINNRVDQMMTAGLLDEVRELVPYRHLNALQTVGYAELLDHLDGKSSIDAAVELIKQHTRQYAKRQMTWFRKDMLTNSED